MLSRVGLMSSIIDEYLLISESLWTVSSSGRWKKGMVHCLEEHIKFAI